MEVSIQRKSHKDTAIITLLLLISACEREAEANELNSAFFNKFNARLYQYCRNVVFKAYGHTYEWEFMADEICQETLITAYHQLKEFEFDKNWSNEIADKKIMGWLCKIAYHKMMDYIRDRKDEHEKHEEYKQFIKLGQDRGKSLKRIVKNNYDKVKIDAFFRSLKPLQIDVIMLCVEYDCIGKNGTTNKKHLPDEIIKNLCEKYGTNSTNLRKVKERVLSKLESCRINE